MSSNDNPSGGSAGQDQQRVINELRSSNLQLITQMDAVRENIRKLSSSTRKVKTIEANTKLYNAFYLVFGQINAPVMKDDPTAIYVKLKLSEILVDSPDGLELRERTKLAEVIGRLEVMRTFYDGYLDKAMSRDEQFFRWRVFGSCLAELRPLLRD
ncbi:hypothetical protein B9479_005772 [Cryptococcus floricola]|uniref:Uncharacterized protein n=1 Tax=Cryptococcus floricola TaxID=2591691 RepID=A0A5D3AS90_9TREE|nr:hypothetical protein B9479_005772 [Cryptococcus floricola]